MTFLAALRHDRIEAPWLLDGPINGEKFLLYVENPSAHFGVSYSSAILWVKRYRETGSLKPRRIGGYRPKKIVGAYRDWLLSRCLEADFTLNGLVGELAERGLEVDYRTVWNFVHAEDLSFKKNRAGQRTGPSRRGVATGTVAEVSRPD